jgi:hypothetical protein
MTTGETLFNGLILLLAGVVGICIDYIQGHDYSFSGGMVWAGWLLIICYFVFKTMDKTKAGAEHP